MHQAEQSSPAVRPQDDIAIRPPNLFELQGRGVSVSFSASSITGEPLFHYKDGSREVSRRGDEIRQVDTEIGKLVTITVELEVDVGSLTFSVLLPRVRLGANGPTRIAALGVHTRHRMPFGPPPIGALQSYGVVKLSGTAQSVLF